MAIMRRGPFHVYILASRSRRLYVGVTSDLLRRLWQHQQGLLPGFTQRYGITTLVHVESFADVGAALSREKQLKRWPRHRKERLIEQSNPTWLDLASG
jgi:putative endonuclease